MYITPYFFKKVKYISIWLQVTRDIATFLMSDFRSGLVCLKDKHFALFNALLRRTGVFLGIARFLGGSR